MKEKLKELKNKKERVESELHTINSEIKAIEQKMLDADKSSYKGKWYCKTESWWNEFDDEYKHYHIVYVKDVRIDFGRTYLEAIIIKADHYWDLRNFEIEVDDDYQIRDLEGMEEMDALDHSRMKDIVENLLECLFEIRTDIKPESFVKDKED